MLIAKHVLDSGFATGIGVGAELSSGSKASASAGLVSADLEEDPDNPGQFKEKDPSSPWGKYKEAKDTNLGDKLFQSLTKDYRENAGKTQSGTSSSLSVAGALAFSFVEQNVRTNVNGTAVLKSNEDLEVVATIKQKFNLGAESKNGSQEGVEEPTDPNNDGSGNGAANNVSVSVAVAIINNSALTTVDSGAELDALRATNVIAAVKYPFKARIDEFVPLSWGELTDAIRADGVGALTKYLNLNLGAKGAFFNTWTTATAKGEDVGIAGSVTVLVFDNEAKALVKAGAEINQDTEWWRDEALNPHPNQAGNRADGNSGDGLGRRHDVIALALVDPTDLEATRKSVAKLGKYSPFATGGERGGAGGAIFISVQDNVTHAIVEDGVAIYSGGDGGFSLKAVEAQLNVNLAQSAAAGGDLAIGGSVLYSGQTSNTLARLGSSASVKGRDARVFAGSNSTLAT